MAKNGQERSAKAAQKRVAVGEVELRHSVRSGIKQMLVELMEWNEISDMGEALQLLILNANSENALPYRNIDTPLLPTEMIRHHARQGIQHRLDGLSGQMFGASHKQVIELLIMCAHGAGPCGSAHYVRVPRHEIRISQNVSRKLELAYRREELRIGSDD